MPKRPAVEMSGESAAPAAPKVARSSDEMATAETLASMEEINAGYNIVNLKKFVDMDIDTAIDDIPVKEEARGGVRGGKKPIYKGGSETAAELKTLTRNILTGAKENIGVIDSKFATLLKNTSLGGILKTAVGIKFIQNPYVFTDVVQTLRGTFAKMIPVAGEGGSYKDILQEVLAGSTYLGKFLITDQVEYVKGSPLYAAALVTMAALLVRYLANQDNMTGYDYLKAKAKYALALVGMAYTTGKQITETLTASETPAQKQEKLIGQLKQAVSTLTPSKKKYEGVGPVGVGDLMVQKPDPATLTKEAAKKLVNTLRQIDPSKVAKPGVSEDDEAANIIAGLAAAPAAAAPGDAPMSGVGRRHRKTKKRVMKKRRMTRRRLTFSY
jgi:hypothetical protein